MDKLLYTAKTALREDPVRLSGTLPDGCDALVTADGRAFPAQNTEDGVTAILTCAADEALTLTPGISDFPKMHLATGADCLAIERCGAVIGGYYWDHAIWKPYFGPICDDAGHPFTRIDFSAKEHPHHRSVYIAVGDVNGVDVWNEPADCGIVRVERLDDVVCGAAFTSFTAHNLWTDHAETPLLRETTTYTMYNQSDACRMLDIAVTFTADFGKVEFGATKEAGPLGIRMRDELRADKGTGRITNARGEKTEAECWGHEAQWCDYTGTLPFGTMGVTAFDHPDNERYPTAWHVRDYGLFAANNLYFKGGLTIPDGGSLTYRFRILFHRAELTADEIAAKYAQYCAE